MPETRQCTLIGLVRVSTDRQGESGLGLEAQHADIERHRQATGCRLLHTYVEIESGGHDDVNDRPVLLDAIRHAKRTNSTLVIARIDRILRSTAAHQALKASGIRFVACDNPQANEFTIDILVAVAAEERRKIQARTKGALAAYKATGRVSKRIREMYPGGVPDDIREATAGKLGAELPQCRNLTDDGRARGNVKANQVQKAKADKFVADMKPMIEELRNEGLSYQAIADRLNSMEFKTPRGKPWRDVQVMRVLKH